MSRVTTNLVPAVDRAARMLGCFGDASQEWRISDLARALEIPKSSAHQIAATLCHHGMLRFNEDNHRYRLGPRLGQIAGRLGHRTDVAYLARPYLDDLAGSHDMTALLGLFAGDATVLAARAEAPQPLGISAPIGLRLYHSAGAFGKLHHAWLAEPELKALLEKRPLRRFTPNTVTALPDYRRELDAVRRRGYAVDREEYLEGVSAVGVPVRDAAGRTIAGICLIALASQVRRSRVRAIGTAAKRAATTLSHDLGYGKQIKP